jgi:ketosteroid isomerase-like protein
MITVVAFLALGLAPQQNQDTAVVQALMRLETVWNEAQQNGDADSLDKLWADELEVTVPKMPVMSKSEVLGFARSGRMKFQRYQTSGVKVRVYGDAAVVSGRLQRTRTLNGKSLDDDWRFIKVYVKRDGRWLVVAFQASDAAQP